MSALVPSHSPNPIPALSDFDGMIRMAQLLAKSSLVPAAYRGKPENVLLATLAGQPFGWDPTMAMRSFHVIEGQPSMKPEIMLALVRRAGHSVTGETSPAGATITGKRRDTGDTMSVTYTLEDARRASLLGKSVWKQYPASMCWARALSQLCRMLFPDVVLGAGYTPEELGAAVDADDVINVEVVAHSPSPADPFVEDVADPTTRDAKPAQFELVKLYTDAGFETAEAKAAARGAWTEAGLALTGPVQIEAVDAVLATVRRDLGVGVTGSGLIQEHLAEKAEAAQAAAAEQAEASEYDLDEVAA
jgi:2-keto-3-deoxy-6-phosphogluconate aldolase